MASYLGFKALDLGFDAHLTVVYLGKLKPNEEYEARARLEEFQAKTRFKWAGKPMVEVKGLSRFGPESEPVTVLRIRPPNAMDEFLKDLESVGFKSVSEYEWNPHITIKLTDEIFEIPRYIVLDQFDLY